jgi:hypothetical protein
LPGKFQKAADLTRDPYIITIRFDAVEDLRLDDFNHQNVIQDLGA